jgi:hypothetical protein
MEMPTPGEAHLRLHRLAGQWGGEEMLHPSPHDPEGGSATAFISNRIALGGLAVLQEYEQYRHGRPTFSGLGLFWFDGAASQYAMTWWDSTMGIPSEFRGDFNGDVLRLVNAMPQGGFARCTFDTGLPGEYVFMMEVSIDGETWAPAMEGAYGLLTPPARRARATSRSPAPRPRSSAKTGPATGTRATRRAATAPAQRPEAKRSTAKNTARKKDAAQTSRAPKAASKQSVATRRSKPGAKAAKPSGARTAGRPAAQKTTVNRGRARTAVRKAGRGAK